LPKKSKRREDAAQSKSSRYATSVLAGAGAVVVLALFGCLDFYQTASAYAVANRDLYQVGLQRTRLLPLMAELPPDAVIGYLSDLPLSDVRGSAAFSGAQYVLAPRVLIRADHPTRPKWVLGVFSRVLDPTPFATSNGVEVVRTLGPGVVLFRRQER
jgi:hypothetical protein